MATLGHGGGIAEYRVGEQTRSGSAGSIFRAEQSALRRPVVLQVATPAADSPEGRRFLEVARLLARVDHPHLLDVYDVDVDEERGVPFAVMREPPGPSLRESIAHGPLDHRRAVRLGEQIASVLETLDAAGVSFQRVSLDDVFVEGSGGDEHAYLAPLGDLVDAEAPGPVLESSPSRSAAALAGLLSSVTELPPAAASGETPSAVALAARRALVPPPRRRLRAAVAALVLAAVAVAAAVYFVTRGGNGPAKPQPVARRVATIPLGSGPRSVTVSADAVWVATANGTAVRVDPRTNQVVGQPIRFSKPQKNSNLTIRAGAGYVFAIDGSAGLLTRIDPRRSAVTGQLHVGGLLNGAAVADGIVWLLRSSPDGVEPPSYQLLRVDASTLRKVGQPYAVGPGALDVEVRDGVAWVTNAGDGTVTRVDPRRHSVRTVLIGAQPIGSLVRGSTLWSPDVWGDSVVPLDTSLLRPPATVVRGMHHPYSVAETPGALWVAAGAGPSTSAPVILDRIDPVAKRLVGLPVRLGEQVGWITAGFGSIWIQDQAANTLVRYDPTRLATTVPPARTPPAHVLRPGPLAPGTWSGRSPVRFQVTIPKAGWLAIGPETYEVEFGRFDAPATTVSVLAPTQLFLPDGRVEPLPGIATIVRALRANRHLDVRALPPATIGGIRATRLSVAVRPFKGYPTFCSDACVTTFGFPNNTILVDAQAPARLSLLRDGRKVIVVFEQTDRVRGSLADTGALVRSLRFR